MIRYESYTISILSKYTRPREVFKHGFRQGRRALSEQCGCPGTGRPARRRNREDLHSSHGNRIRQQGDFKMNRFKTWLTGAVIGVAVVASAAAPVAAARTLDEIIASKKLIVGINPTLPPLGVFN